MAKVRHVTELNNNLISLRYLDSRGYKYIGQGGKLKVPKGILVVMWARKIGNLYRLEGNTKINEALVVFEEASESTRYGIKV